MEVTTIGIDIAKRIFQLHGVNNNGKTVLKKRLMRDQVLIFMSNNNSFKFTYTINMYRPG